MKNLVLLIALTMTSTTFAANALEGDFTLNKENTACADRIVITKDKGCYLFDTDGATEKACSVNLGPKTVKVEIAEDIAEEDKDLKTYKTTNILKVGAILTIYETVATKNKYYRTINRTVGTRIFAATKEKLYLTASSSKMSLVPSSAMTRCEYIRVAE